MPKRRKVHASTRKGRRAVSRLRYSWKKRTSHGGGKRKAGRYSHLAAVVRRNKNGTVRAGRRKHVKGHSWTGRKGTVALYSRQTGKLWGTNPRKRGSRRGGLMRRFNPSGIATEAKSLIVTPVMNLPKSVPALLKGKIVKHAAFATGGAVVALVGGTMLQGVAMPLIAKIPGAAGVLGGGMAQRVIGASFALVAGGVAARVALKDTDARNAAVTGAAAAALIEAIFPGRLAAMIARSPLPASVTSQIAPAASPVQGLAGMFGTDDLAMGAYVQAPGYQGVGAYVEAPGYQGVGAYVQAPGYQGVGDLEGAAGLGYAGEQLAGNLDGMGSNMMSHLDA